MTYSLVFTESYNRRAKKWLKKHPELQGQYLKVLKLLELNPFHPSLRLHALQGRLQEVYSVSINLSYRITIEILVSEAEIVLLNIGSHDAVYR